MLQNRKLLTKASWANRTHRVWAYESTRNADDFGQEIEDTRANEVLMAHLQMRAQEPATTSLEEVKRRLLEFAPSDSV